MVLLRGSGRKGLGRPLFLSLVGEGGLEISTSGLLNIYMMLNIYDVLWVFNLYAGDNGPSGTLCPRDTFPNPGPLLCP